MDELEDWNIFVAMAEQLAGMNREMMKPSLTAELKVGVELTDLKLARWLEQLSNQTLDETFGVVFDAGVSVHGREKKL